MRFPTFLLLAWMAAVVSGNGIRVGYEKIMLFYAYRIDQLLPESERTIGVRCGYPPKDAYDPCLEPTDGKRDKYEPCQVVDTVYDRAQGKRVPKGSPRACNLAEFLGHIDKKKYASIKGMPLMTGDTGRLDFDIDHAAKKIVEYEWDDNRNPPYRVFKDGSLPEKMVNGKTSFNGMLDSVFERAALAKSRLSAEDYDKAENKDLFDRLDKARGQVHRARTADNDYWVKMDLEAKIPGIKVETEGLGYKEHIDGQMRDVFLILNEETINSNKDSIPDVEKKMMDVRTNRLVDNPSDTDEQRKSAKSARDHQVVLESFSQGGVKLQNALPGCGS